MFNVKLREKPGENSKRWVPPDSALFQPSHPQNSLNSALFSQVPPAQIMKQQTLIQFLNLMIDNKIEVAALRQAQLLFYLNSR
jgi:hypothetical protein